MSSRRRREKKQSYRRTGTVVLGRTRSSSRSVSRPDSERMQRVTRISLLLLAAATVLSIWLAVDQRFYIYRSDVTVKGAVHISPDAVFQASELAGLHVLWVDRKAVSAHVQEAIPAIENARVRCGLLTNCTLAVEEREPVVTWKDEGSLWWIDDQGIVFSAERAPTEESLQGWLVSGPLPRDGEHRLEERVLIALNELRAIDPQLTPVLRYRPGRGFVFTDHRGWRVVVGKGAGVEERLALLEQLASSLQARDLTPQFVDVRFPEAAYYSLTNEW